MMPLDTLPARPARTAGRPREFQIDDALDQAILVFSERGYHATSIAELKDAMQIASGSLYKAFKDKKAIFLAAFDRYKQLRDGVLAETLAQGSSGRDKVSRMLRFYAEASHGEAGIRGCIVVGGATELALFDAETAERVTRSMARNEELLRRLIIEGQADGSISADLDVAATARLMLCLTQGLRLVGKTGPSRAQALSVADTALKLLD